MRPAVRDLAFVLAVSWLARAAFIAAIGDAQSADVGHWEGVLQAQDEGRNPYELGVLNWPPLWLVVLVGADYVANLVNVEFWTALRVYLVAVESALVATLYLTLVSVGGGRIAVRRALLVGIALNPLAILLVCQHGNSDVQVGLLVTLAAAALCSHWRSKDVVMWLVACLFVGLGVLAKTVPLVLAPILAPGARLASSAGRALGAALFVGPALVGLGVIAALVPIAVRDHVIGYRSTSGFFGIGGILDEVAAESGEWYERAFTIGVLAAIAVLSYRLWRAPPLAPPQVFLLTATIFMVVVALGPGYGPQYAYWFMPALIATYVLLDPGWKRAVLAAYAVAAATYAVTYALIPWLGAYAVAIIDDSDSLADLGAELDTPGRLVALQLPLFAAYVVLIVLAMRRLSSPERYDAKL